MSDDEDTGSAQNAAGYLRDAMKKTRLARQQLEQLAPSPPRDTLIPEPMKVLVRQYGLVHLALHEFEGELLTRYEVFG